MLPNLIVIGAMKCGTSSLYHYLTLHPDVFMSTPKELDFFIKTMNWNKGIKWYESHFRENGKASKIKIYGEASTNYSKHPTFIGVPSRMYSLLPDVKLIYLIRNPIDRIVSHYIHNYYDELEDRSFSEILSNFDNNHYINCSKYYMQLEQYLNYYPKKNILVIATEELNKFPQDTMKRLFNFLNIDASFYSQKFTKVIHKTAEKGRRNAIGRLISKIPIRKLLASFLPQFFQTIYRKVALSQIDRPILDNNTRKKLVEYLKDDIDQLKNYTGNDFRYWDL